jgi:hypothetical protein
LSPRLLEEVVEESVVWLEPAASMVIALCISHAEPVHRASTRSNYSP